MQKKIVKRIKKELRKLGCNKFERVNTIGWYNPKVYALRVYFLNTHILSTCGKTELQAYKMALKLIKLEKDRAFISRNCLWDYYTERNMLCDEK